MEPREEIILYDTRFVMDRAKQRFVEVANAANVIAFSEFDSREGHATALYDPDLKKIHHADDQNSVLRVFMKELRIPLELLKRPVPTANGMVEAFNKRHSGKNFQLLEDASRNRLWGRRPIVVIEGERYRFIAEQHRLVNIRNKKVFINTKYMNVADELKSMQFIYNRKTRREYDGPELVPGSPVPKHLVLIRMPNEMRLDPVAEAWRFGKPAEDLLVHTPFRDEVYAERRDWADWYKDERLIIGKKQNSPRQPRGFLRRKKN